MCLGSTLHALQALSRPRWEDFEYTYWHDNPVAWLGDGWTDAEKKNNFDAWYLDKQSVDVPPITTID